MSARAGEGDNVEPGIELFGNGREANLSSTIAMIEDVLIELGHFLNECRLDDPVAVRAWSVVKGSASIRIKLVEAAGVAHIRLVSPLMTMDHQVDRPRLFQHLLELNGSTVCGAAFAIQGDEVLLVSERPTLDLDRSEVLDLLTRVQLYADAYDNQLVEQFGGTIGRRTVRDDAAG
jgi:hypothetical protein